MKKDGEKRIIFKEITMAERKKSEVELKEQAEKNSYHNTSGDSSCNISFLFWFVSYGIIFNY